MTGSPIPRIGYASPIPRIQNSPPSFRLLLGEALIEPLYHLPETYFHLSKSARAQSRDDIRALRDHVAMPLAFIAGRTHRLRDRIDAEVLAARLTAARRAGAKSLATLPPRCKDCGSAAISVAAAAPAAGLLDLAREGEDCARVSDPAGMEVLRWFVSIMLRTGRKYWGAY